MILERILEDLGLERGLHYEVQSHQRDEEGKAWRPDVLVKLPKDKTLIIDSKVSLVSYEAGVNAETDEERNSHITAHVRAMERHIDTLSAKGYHALADGSVDYVLMFVPIEGALAEALKVKGDLTSYALQKSVGIMTPTTLMVALRTVEHIWAVERRESNAEEIADRAGRLYDKVCGFVAEMEKVGDCLRRAHEAHGTAFDRLSRGGGNVLGQVEKLKKLGARTSRWRSASMKRTSRRCCSCLPNWDRRRQPRNSKRGVGASPPTPRHRHIRPPEIPAGEQQRRPLGSRHRVGRAVAEVQPRRVPPLAVAQKRPPPPHGRAAP